MAPADHPVPGAFFDSGGSRGYLPGMNRKIPAAALAAFALASCAGTPAIPPAPAAIPEAVSAPAPAVAPPNALSYFDVLPESHKARVGFVFLTKGDNTAIRELSATGAGDYFDGAYAYSGGQLEPLDLSGAAEAPYRAAAKRFFGKISPYKLATHAVGASTLNFSMVRGRPDVYLASDASPDVLVHEMGHVADYGGNYTDYAVPRWPWTRSGALNDYGATHPGEDFAEAYRLYVLRGAEFREAWAPASAEWRKKYEYLKTRVFSGSEYAD